MYHPERVSEWLKGKNIYPIYVEIAPAGTCNHRCIFCALDYMEYKPVFLDTELISKNLAIMSECGVKSVMYAGEGEPLLNKNTPEIVNLTKSLGLDVSMTSNGVFFTNEIAQSCINSFTWVRFSVNAGTSGTYKKVHKGKDGDFEKVITNISNAVKIKKDKKLKTTIGVQLLLIPENKHEVFVLAKLLKETGIDYFSVKPYSQHPKSVNTIDTSFDYDEHLDLERQLAELQTENFNIIFRSNAMKKLKSSRYYNKCYGMPFWAYVDAGANVWACSAYLGDKDFCYGSLKEKNFIEIWNSGKRRQIIRKAEKMDISECREICRLDEINRYLYRLRNPEEHDNFI